MKCSKCGEEVNENQGFCLKCGNPIQLEPDFNSIEAELANSVLEFMEDNKETSEPIPEDINDEDILVTVDVPYEEINMQLKMVDINRGNQPSKASNVKKEEVTKEHQNESSKKKTSLDKEQNKNKKSGKKGVIILGSIAAIVAIILIIVGIFFVKNYLALKTYDGNYDKAKKCYDAKEYDDSLMYAKDAVSLSTSDIEEVKARKLLNDIYVSKNIKNDEFAENLKKMIILGEKDKENYLTLVGYYYDNKQYTKINDVVKTIEDDSVIEAMTKYIPQAPVPEQESGGYTGYVVVKLSAEDDCTIYYILNSEDTLNGGVAYTNGVKIVGEGKQKLTCYAVDKNGVESKRVSFEYQITQGELEGPKVTPSSGSYSTFTKIEVEVPEGGKAYYTLDGTDPTSESLEYTEPLDMPRGQTKFKVIVYDSFDLPSAITSESYNLSIPRALSISDANVLVNDTLVAEEIMLEDGTTPYGKMVVEYEKIAEIGKDEFYIFNACEYDSESQMISTMIYGVNTYDGTLTDKIIDADGVYVLPEEDEEETE